MKKLMFFIIATIFISCNKENLNNSMDFNQDGYIHILDSSIVKETIQGNVMNITIFKENNNVYLASDGLVKIEYKNENGENLYGYILKLNKRNRRNLEIPEEEYYELNYTEGGYAFNGRCFVYGHFSYYWDGEEYYTSFTSCGSRCVGFPNICPKWNQEYGK